MEAKIRKKEYYCRSTNKEKKASTKAISLRDHCVVEKGEES
jgi:hypothetical protein